MKLGVHDLKTAVLVTKNKSFVQQVCKPNNYARHQFDEKKLHCLKFFEKSSTVVSAILWCKKHTFNINRFV